jgi:amino acid adenylation domain-containing protein/FkbM family methyltransferase
MDSTPYAKLCLHELIEEQARRTPDAEALVFESERLTYAELERRADLLAARLRVLCDRPETRVGLYLERSAELVIGILAVLKAGAAYVPLDISYPEERIAFLCADAGIKVLLTDRERLAQCPAGPEHALCLDTFDWFAAPEAPLEAPARKAKPEDLAYVIYTSGTTGKPKGVCIEHRSIVNYVLAISQRLRLQPGMAHAHVSTFAADLGNTVLFPSLATGGCLHVLSRERAESQALLSEYFARERIDVLKIAPSHLAALQSGHGPERVMPRRILVLGGEFSRPDRIERLRALAPRCEIYNHYGPTETTVGVLTYHVGSAIPATPSGTIPAGTPLANVSAHILDPKDGKGELCIGGACVARGYLGRDTLTAAKFIERNGERLYRTGDLARRLPDGNIELCGRIDRQVKLSGYRVELDEVEAALRGVPGVQDAAVLAHARPSGELHSLVGYVVPRSKEQPLWSVKSVHELPDGSAVAHLNKNETDYIYNEIFVLQAYLRHGIAIRDGDCIVDAGSNIGLFTVFASRLAPHARILAFEPNPAAFVCLRTNAEASGAQVRCFAHGLARENGFAEMTFFEGFSLLSGFHADAATEKAVVRAYVANQSEDLPEEVDELIEDKLRAKTLRAQLRPLSAVIAEQGIERIDLLKVNVEKSELDVLLGIEARDWPKIRQLVIEVDEHKSLAPILQLLARHGYETLVEQDELLRDTDLCYVYAIRPSAEGRLVREQPAGAHVRPVPRPAKYALAPSVLKKCLKRTLPPYMVPSAFVLLDRLPLNANGKVDTQALAALATAQPNPGGPNPAGAFAKPRSETEKTLARLWDELLKAGPIGIHDDFFDLGGQSMMAIQLVARIRDAFGVDVALRNLFERPTIAALAELVDAMALSSAKAQPKSGREEFVL